MGAALLTVGLLPATSQAATTSVQTQYLKAVGPVSADTGFPTYVQSSKNLRLAHCLYSSPLCGDVRDTLPDPSAPVSFPDNFPAESFFFSATSSMPLPAGGRARFSAAIMAKFGGPVASGNQQLVNRVQLLIDVPGAGHYTVTDPYGVEDFDVTAADPVIDFTDDVGAVNGAFGGVLDGRVDPFLIWDTGMITGSDGGHYIGDPATAHAVVGSPFGTNFFRIDGPNIGGSGINTLTTSQFKVVGRLATNSGVDPGHPTYSRTDTSGGMVDVRAHSTPNSAIRALLPGDEFTTSLRGGSTGDYVGRLSFTGALPPAVVTISNTSDTPDAVYTPKVTDLVTITGASYDADHRILAVSAVSSDQAVPPTLTVTGFGDLSPGTQTLSPATITPPTATMSSAASVANVPEPITPPTLVGTVSVGAGHFTDVASPPATVTVTSSAGGVATAQVAVSGSAFPTDPVSADAGLDQAVQQGQTVTLDGSGTLNATSVAWVQTSGPAVTLTGADSTVATFVAPNEVTALSFQLIAQGPGGPDTDDVTIAVQPLAPPVADAGPDQHTVVGITVVLDGTGSTGAATYAWTQVSGPTVLLLNANTARPTFVMPAGVVVFRLEVTGPGGSDSDEVSISSAADVLTVTKAEFRSDKAEWRIEGTSSITITNIVTVYLGDTTLGAVIGSAQVDAFGIWSVRVTNSTVPPFGDTVTIKSSRGGLLAGVLFVVR